MTSRRRIGPGDVVLFKHGSMAGTRAQVMVLRAEWNSRTAESQVMVTLWPHNGQWFDMSLDGLSMSAVFGDAEGSNAGIHPGLWGSSDTSSTEDS